MAKKTKNLNLPILTPDDYETTKVVDMVDDIQGDKEGSAFNIIDSAVETINTNVSALDTKIDTKQSKLGVNSSATPTSKLSKLTIDGTVYSLEATVDAVDTELSPTSENPVQNKAIYGAYATLSDQVSQIISSEVTVAKVQEMIDAAVLNALNDTY